jgi:hypothetical protein
MPGNTTRTQVLSRRRLHRVVLVIAATLMPAASAANNQPFRVVVNAKNPMRSASTDFLCEIFLKRVTRWNGGETIKPVDLRPDAEARRKFSGRVLKRSVAAVRSYWQQRIFSGRGVPPPELDSDDAVIKYVSKHPQAIGYIAGDSSPGATREVVVR